VRQIELADGRATFFHADVGSETELRALLAFAEETYGGVDIIVNNASAIEQEAPLERWRKTVQVDLIGTMHGVFIGLEALRRRHGGAIVNMSSTSALGHGRGHSPWPAYDTAKAAVIRLTTCLASLREREGHPGELLGSGLGGDSGSDFGHCGDVPGRAPGLASARSSHLGGRDR
jgi:3-hydroxybutyrate dehydrogenase